MALFSKSCPFIDEARATGRGLHFVLEIVKFVVLFFVLEVIMGVGGELFSVTVLRTPLISTATLLYIEIIGIALTLLFCRVCEKRRPTSLGFTREKWLTRYLAGLGIGFGMFSLVVLLGTVTGGFLYAGLFEEINPLKLAVLLGGFMIQGMYEEVICRGFLMVSMARKNPLWLSVLLSAALFSLLHIMNNGFTVLPAVNLFLFGVFASLFMLKTGHIWGVGAIHAVWNFVQGCFYGFSVSGMPLSSGVFVFVNTDKLLINGGAFGPEGGLCVTAVCVFGIAAVMLWDRRETARSN